MTPMRTLTILLSLLLAGRLPEERACVVCGVPTDGSLLCRTECERAYVRRSRPPF